jgi:DNA polymerase-3 subunit epsilon
MENGSGKVIPYDAEEALRLRELIDAARSRLASIESECTIIQRKLQAQRAAIFERLAPASKARDRLRLRVRFLGDLLEGLRSRDEEATETASANFHAQWSQTEHEYTKAQGEFSASRTASTSDEEEIASLWRKLVKLYHPDKLGGTHDLRDTYHPLIAAINHARDTGNVEMLREIAADAAGFVARKGWGSLDTAEQQEIADLQRLLKSLQEEIVKVADVLARLKRSSDYELAQLIIRRPEVFEQVVDRQLTQIEAETALLQEQAGSLGAEIERLTGEPPPED